MVAYDVEVQLRLFVKHVLFFPPGACCLHFREAIQPRRILYYTGGTAKPSPLYPLGHSQLKYGKRNQTNEQTFHGLQKYENKKARNESNKCNPYAGANNYHCLGFPSRSKHSACRPLGLPASVFRSPGLRPSGNPLMKHCQAAVCLSTKCELRLLKLSLVRM